jgi:hypothetical protein
MRLIHQSYGVETFFQSFIKVVVYLQVIGYQCQDNVSCSNMNTKQTTQF